MLPRATKTGSYHGAEAQKSFHPLAFLALAPPTTHRNTVESSPAAPGFPCRSPSMGRTPYWLRVGRRNEGCNNKGMGMREGRRGVRMVAVLPNLGTAPRCKAGTGGRVRQTLACHKLGIEKCHPATACRPKTTPGFTVPLANGFAFLLTEARRQAGGRMSNEAHRGGVLHTSLCRDSAGDARPRSVWPGTLTGFCSRSLLVPLTARRLSKRVGVRWGSISADNFMMCRFSPLSHAALQLNPHRIREV